MYNLVKYIEGQGYLMSDDIKTLLGCFAPKTPLTFFQKSKQKKGTPLDRKKKYDDKFVRKTLRFTPDEFAKIEEQREKTNLDFTSFCKSAILKKKVKTTEEENFNRDLIYQVNKIGINLNQIARAVNQKDRVAVLTELVEIEKQLRALNGR